MENQKKFEEGIRTYRTRIDTELENIRMNLPGFDDPRNTPSSHRILVQYMRRSLDKMNSYFHNIEMIVEKEYAENAKNVNQNDLRPVVPGGEDIKT